MNTRIRRLGIALLVLYLALFVMLNWIQVAKRDEYNASPLNSRQTVRDFAQSRGVIQSADGVVLAKSEPVDDRYRYLRTYPTGQLFAHITGSLSFAFGSSGIERQYNDQLAGQTAEQKVKGFIDLFIERTRLADVTLTVRNDVQTVAAQALGEQEGSVVALDPRTGAILAMYSWPSYDPNLLASHDFNAVKQIREQLNTATGKPLLGNAFQERYFPGSTFKIVTGAAGLESGKVTASTPVYPVEQSFTPPLTTKAIGNFGGATCGGNLVDALRVSCNTVFARMGLEIGAPQMVATSEAFGFNSPMPLDLPGPVATSFFPSVADFDRNDPKLAQSAFGQNDVQASPLHMALVAAAVANNGTMMAPHVLKEIRDSDGEQLASEPVQVWKRAMSPASALVLRDAMVEVVRAGTATRMAIDGVTVAGKTGTAQLGTDPPSSHAWVVGFAPAEAPRVAVAVLVKAQPGVSEVTGGRVAAPIAQQVLTAALAVTR
ncbi:MAG: peptidoglycan D,D-transpeptidase FtsI family protein [Acidimicrobiia bacterium]